MYVLTAVGAGVQAVNYFALARYGEMGLLKCPICWAAGILACLAIFSGLAATLGMTVLGRECAGIAPLLCASAFSLSLLPALNRMFRHARPKEA